MADNSWYDYDGDDIRIEEMPQGCIIVGDEGYVRVSSLRDALNLMKSLGKMVSHLIEDLEAHDG